MYEYPKTENLYARDPDTHKLTGELRSPAFDQVTSWLVTEKVDGTNIRVLLRYVSGENEGTVAVDVRGRSDRANVPGDLSEKLLGHLHERKDALFAFVEQLTGNDPEVQVCLYGEGYGPGIQKAGGKYRADKALRIFDVTTTKFDRAPHCNEDFGCDCRPQPSTWWRAWEEVERASELLGIPTVPVLYSGRVPVDVLFDDVRAGIPSQTAYEDGGDRELVSEGIVARTDPYLYDFRGSRVMFKLKTEDLS